MSMLIAKYGVNGKSYTPWSPPYQCYAGYSFDDVTGTTIHDVTGAHDIVDSSPIVAGKVKKGISGGVSVPWGRTQAALRHGVCAWIKVPDFSVSRQLYHMSAAYESAIIQTNGQIKYEVYYNSTWYTYFFNHGIQANTWCFFQKIVEPDGRRRFRINASEKWNGHPPTGVDNGSSLSFGATGIIMDNLVLFDDHPYGWALEDALYNSGEGVKF